MSVDIRGEIKRARELHAQRSNCVELEGATIEGLTRERSLREQRAVESLLQESEALLNKLKDKEGDQFTEEERRALSRVGKKLKNILNGKYITKEEFVWDRVVVSEDLTVTFKDPDLSVQFVIDELEKQGVRVSIHYSFADPGFLNQKLATEFRIVDTSCNEEGSTQVLESAGLPIEPDNKLENLAAVLVFYLKEKSGVELTTNEKRLLDCYDNRSRSNFEAYSWVSCGASSLGVFIHESGDVRAYNVCDFSHGPRFPSALLSRN